MQQLLAEDSKRLAIRNESIRACTEGLPRTIFITAKATQADEKLRKENTVGKRCRQQNPLRSRQKGTTDHKEFGRNHARRLAYYR